ncbi:hypothetical protein HOY82DRAFT_606935 [Tuber indicum]|nr:hypothetical protein HOY82DRAFT_613088 [Tuber indicum]KAG0132000.1 hypothetical protein HOY82DRAFT_606935 [Tuber indicum]
MVSAAGFTLRTALWGDHAFRAAKVYSPLDEIEDTSVYDYILDTTKSLPGNLRWQQMVSKNLLTASPFPGNPIALGMLYIAISQPAPGEIYREGKVNDLRIGPDHFLLEEEQEKIQLFGDALGRHVKSLSVNISDTSAGVRLPGTDPGRQFAPLQGRTSSP